MKYAIINANLLDGTKNMSMVENADILVENGKIVGVGKFQDTKGYEIIDVKGQYVLPGLINMHVHLPSTGFPQKEQKDKSGLVNFVKNNPIGRKVGEVMTRTGAKDQLYSGTTTVRAVGGVDNFDSLVRDGINSGRWEGPRIVSCNEAITVKGGHMEGTVSYGAKDYDDMRRHIDEQVKKGADWVKVMITGGVLDAKKKGEPGELKMTKEEVQVCVDEAHKLGKKVAAHVESPEGLVIAAETGVDSIEHGAHVDENIIKVIKDNGATVVCTISPAIPVINIDCGFKDRDMAVANGKALGKGMIQCAKECLKNNIPLGLGTDAGCPFTTHYDTWRELEYFHRYLGVSREEALYIATLNNATILGLEKETGSLEVGKSADFIVTKKNPLEGFDALRNLSMVALRGKITNNPRPKKSADVEKELDYFYYNELSVDEVF